MSLVFDYKIGDVVNLSDGRLAIISHYGIYDNQYWCEVCYPDGVRLGAADYFSLSDITGLCGQEKERVIREVRKAVNAMLEKFPYLKESTWCEDRFKFLEAV